MNKIDRRGCVHGPDTERAKEHSSACDEVEESSLQTAVDFLFRSTEAVRKSGRTRREIFHSEVAALREWGQVNGLILKASVLNLVALNAHPHNILRDESGNLVPIDLVVGTPVPWTRKWLGLDDESICQRPSL